jgi:TPR repeat protein
LFGDCGSFWGETAVLRVLTFLLCALFATTGALAETRVAFVVGNAAYEHAGNLANPVNDATDVATLLERLNFDVVLGVDLTEDEFGNKLAEFANKLQTADVALFYYAGHGIQYEGENYLIPVDAALENDIRVRRETMSLEEVVDQMQGTRVRLVFIDACRNNPFAEKMRSASVGTNRALSIGRGLALPSVSGRDMLIAFAAEPDKVAADGTGRNSPFTKAMLKHLPTPGEDITAVLRLVTSDVRKETNGEQSPQQVASMETNFYMVPRDVVVEPIVPIVDPPPGGGSGGTVDPEQFLFAAAERAGTIEAWEAFVTAYPDSVLKGVAEAYLKKLRTDVAKIEPVVPPVTEPEPAKTGADEEIAKLLADAMTAYGNRRYEDAVRHYTAAVDLGSAIAMGDLAYLTEQGLGTSKSPSRAVELYLAAIEAGNAFAAYNYGWMLERGEGITRNPAEAARRLVYSLTHGTSDSRQNILSAMLADVGNLGAETRKALQQELRDRGLYSGSIDGSFGPASKAALTRLAEGS